MGKRTIACCASFLCLAASATAHELAYVAPLSSTTEPPPNNSMGLGFAVVILDLDLFRMHVDLTYTGLSGTTSAAHIHAPTLEPLAGFADVATMSPSFAGFESGLTAGSYNQEFDLTQASAYNPAFIAASGGTISSASDVLLDALDDGTAYIDIHTTEYVGGEIRGFLLPTPKADFDHNGLVDGDDLAVWSESLGVDHEGDANDDEVTDGQDFLIWQHSFRAVAHVGSGHGHAIAVPEPGAAGFVTVFGAMTAAHARRQTNRRECIQVFFGQK